MNIIVEDAKNIDSMTDMTAEIMTIVEDDDHVSKTMDLVGFHHQLGWGMIEDHDVEIIWHILVLKWMVRHGKQ